MRSRRKSPSSLLAPFLCRLAASWPWDAPSTTESPFQEAVIQIMTQGKCIGVDIDREDFVLTACDASDETQLWVWSGTIRSRTKDLCFTETHQVPVDAVCSSDAAFVNLVKCNPSIKPYQEWSLHGCRIMLEACKDTCVDFSSFGHRLHFWEDHLVYSMPCHDACSNATEPTEDSYQIFSISNVSVSYDSAPHDDFVIRYDSGVPIQEFEKASNRATSEFIAVSRAHHVATGLLMALLAVACAMAAFRFHGQTWQLTSMQWTRVPQEDGDSEAGHSSSSECGVE